MLRSQYILLLEKSWDEHDKAHGPLTDRQRAELAYDVLLELLGVNKEEADAEVSQETSSD